MVLKRWNAVKRQIAPGTIDEVTRIGREKHTPEKRIQATSIHIRVEVGFNSDDPISDCIVDKRARK